MSRPSLPEVSALLADLRASDSGNDPELMARKADLLERIAAATPDDQDAAEVAALARERAEQLKTTN